MHKENTHYRRTDDEPAKLLTLLNERMKVVQTEVEKLLQKQGKLPCDTHEIRLRFLEKITWVVISAVILLTLKAIFSLFSALP